MNNDSLENYEDYIQRDLTLSEQLRVLENELRRRDDQKDSLEFICYLSLLAEVAPVEFTGNDITGNSAAISKKIIINHLNSDGGQNFRVDFKELLNKKKQSFDTLKPIMQETKFTTIVTNKDGTYMAEFTGAALFEKIHSFVSLVEPIISNNRSR